MTEKYAFGTFSQADETPWPGIVQGGKVIPMSRVVSGTPPSLGRVFAEWSRWSPEVENAMRSPPRDGWQPEHAMRVHLPYLPENLLGAGANYRRHVIELIVDKGAGGVTHLSRDERLAYGTKLMDERARSGKPYVYVAMRGAVIGAHDDLVVPYDLHEPDWELELAVVIGRRARRVPQSEALRYVAGYTIANDITARELVGRPDIPQMGMDWLASKNAPGFKIIGPYIVPAAFVPDPQRMHIRLSLNGEVMQDEGTDDMIFPVARLIEFITSYVELGPGDIIMTGSPSGNGTHYDRFLRGGDLISGEIDGLLGAQKTRCVTENTPAG